MSLPRILISAFKRWSLSSRKRNLDIHPSVHLHRQFSLRFMAEPADRLYLTVGERTMINAQILFESRDGSVRIGKRSYVGSATQIICRNGVTIGDDVTIAWGVMIYDHNSHSLDWRQRSKVVKQFYDSYGASRCYEDMDWTDVKSAPVSIGDKAWIGFDAVVLKGVNIGEGAIVAARSVVTRDVEPYTIVAGNPAVVVKRLDVQANRKNNE